MEIIQLVIGILVIIAVKFLVIKFIYNRLRMSNLSDEELKFDKIRPIYNQLKKNKTPEANTILRSVKIRHKRVLVYEALKLHDRIDLFPNAYSTREKAAESYLVNWLNMHDEYDAIPDEIEFVKTMDLDNELSFSIFKFKSYEPHLLANRNWMFGYVSHNKMDMDKYAAPKFIISEFDNTEMSIEIIKKSIKFE